MKKLAVFSLVVVTVFSLFVGVLAESTSEPTQDQLEALAAVLEDDSSEAVVADQFRVQVSPDDLSVVSGLDPDWVNILLLGTDTGSAKLNYGRTDTMLILSVNKVTGKMRLASLVRDMYVDIPHLAVRNRINTANAFGGPLYAIKVVNETLGLNITDYCSVNFKGFKDIIDYLGGVTMTLSLSEAHIAGAKGTTEPQLLNGEQALAYVRIRQLDDNFGRNTRQRKLLDAMLQQVLSEGDLTRTMAALTETLKHLSTNMTINEVLQLVPAVLKSNEGMDMAGFPVAGDYKSEMIGGTRSVVIFDQQATTEKLHRFIYEGVTP